MFSSPILTKRIERTCVASSFVLAGVIFQGRGGGGRSLQRAKEKSVHGKQSCLSHLDRSLRGVVFNRPIPKSMAFFTSKIELTRDQEFCEKNLNFREDIKVLSPVFYSPNVETCKLFSSSIAIKVALMMRSIGIWFVFQ